VNTRFGVEGRVGGQQVDRTKKWKNSLSKNSLILCAVCTNINLEDRVHSLTEIRFAVIIDKKVLKP